MIFRPFHRFETGTPSVARPSEVNGIVRFNQGRP
jgi:hypothetical protein